MAIQEKFQLMELNGEYAILPIEDENQTEDAFFISKLQAIVFTMLKDNKDLSSCSKKISELYHIEYEKAYMDVLETIELFKSRGFYIE